MKILLIFFKPNMGKIVILIIFGIIAVYFGMGIDRFEPLFYDPHKGVPWEFMQLSFEPNLFFFPSFGGGFASLDNPMNYILTLIWWYILSCIIHWLFSLIFKKKQNNIENN